MKRLSFILAFMLMFSSVALAQKSEKQMQKEARKAARENYQAAVFEEVEKSVNERKFIIEVDKIRLKDGTSIFSNSMTNFICLNGDKAVLQLSPNNSALMGPNGLGGITVEGNASDVRITKDRRENINISMSIQGSIISAQVSINIPKGSNRAVANVIPNFNSHNIVLMGVVVPIENSNVFKGRTTP